MKVAFIVPFAGKQQYQRDYDDIFRAIEAAGATVLGPENKKSRLYREVISQDSRLHGRSRAHYDFVRKSILDSDAVVVEASYEDFRVGHETTLALLYRKPVLALSQRLDLGGYIHHPDFTGVRYRPSQARDVVATFLDQVRRRRVGPHHAVQASALQQKIDFSTHKNIAVFGGIYADIFNKVPHIPAQGEVVLSAAFKMLLGGKATNAAVAMARLGNDVMLLGHIGRDSLGGELDAVLLHENIVTDFVTRDELASTGTVSVAVDAQAKASTIVHEAANILATRAGVDRMFALVDAGKLHVDCLYITLETQPEAIDYVIREARKRGIFIFCDAAPHVRPLDPALLPLIDIVAPNQVEAEAMTGIAVHDAATARKAATKLIGVQHAREVIITLGDNGVYHQSADPAQSMGQLPAVKVDAVDELGAGDAFRAAFVTDFLQHHDRRAALSYGSRAGAFAATRFGTYDSLPTHDELKFFAAPNTLKTHGA